ncbi:DUF739 family protein [Listeria booriae]|uniref:DUF739 family protein n=1 Tax=Listeria booriae TaxID=1552123 RepID=UPI001625C9ED|nr:DUF739 family protein [Listeria booriae]MBC2106114.1 DUF739 family protein [Listeria booriae]
MSFDYSALIGKIAQKCDNQRIFAQKMGLSERSVSLKVNGKVGWKQAEISRALTILDISKRDIPKYFFNVKVQ